jgi:hypothetical protein
VAAVFSSTPSTVRLAAGERCGGDVRPAHHQPFGLSLSKVRHLRGGPFDKLRVNGEVVMLGPTPSTVRPAAGERCGGDVRPAHHQPFGLSLSKVRHLRVRPFDKLRVNGEVVMLGPTPSTVRPAAGERCGSDVRPAHQDRSG